jgi:hypothetical protein
LDTQDVYNQFETQYWVEQMDVTPPTPKSIYGLLEDVRIKGLNVRTLKDG